MSRLARMGPAPRWGIKVAAWSVVVTLALMALLLPLVDPSHFASRAWEKTPSRPHDAAQIRHDTHVRRVQALKAHRDLARRCVAAVRKRAPEIATNGKPTLIHIAGGECAVPCRGSRTFSNSHHAVWRGRGLNSLRVSTASDGVEGAAADGLFVPACAALVSGQFPDTRLVLDRKGDLFWAGSQENWLKGSLWLPDPRVSPAPDRFQEGRGISILLQSGNRLHDVEAVEAVTWARVCKWHRGECIAVAREQRAVRRLDEMSAEKLVEAGEAEAKRLDYYGTR